MARYTGAKCRLCRREGEKLFLKGARCLSEKCAITRRPQVPGQHFKQRSRLSDYGKHLREKQKAKRIYGMLEAQFKGTFEKAAKIKGVTGEVFLQMLETRLDSVVFLSGFATSRQSARQMIRHNKVKVDGKIIDIPSYQISKDNLISVDTIQSRTKVVEDLPVWISWDEKKNGISVINLPNRDDISSDINEQLIVEFYSR